MGAVRYTRKERQYMKDVYLISTYKEIAAALGRPSHRAIGNWLSDMASVTSTGCAAS